MEKNLDQLNLQIKKLKRSPKMGEIFELYLQENRIFLKEKTILGQKTAWISHLYKLDKIRADNLNPLLFQKIILEPVYKDKHYVNALYLTRLTVTILKFAVTIQIIQQNPLDTVWELPLIKYMKKLSSQNLTHRPSFNHNEIESQLTKLLKVFKEKTCERRQLLLEFSLKFLLRPGEMVKLKITDLDTKQHILIAHDTKTFRDFKIPTNKEMEEKIEYTWKKYGSPSTGFIFCGLRDPSTALSGQVLNKALKELGYKNLLCAHGIRSIGSNWFSHRASKVPPYVREAILQHVSGKVERAYRRDDFYLKQRREAMLLWWDFLDRLYKKI